jgi:hypothetical protein
MRRSGIATLCAFILLVVSVMPAYAGIGWCKSDPVVAIDGELAEIVVSAPVDAPLVVTGPTQVVVTLPDGVDGALLVTDLGFGQGYEVAFAHSKGLKVTDQGIQVWIAIYVPATDSAMPVQVEFAPGVVGLLAPASAMGTANAWIKLKTVL